MRENKQSQAIHTPHAIYISGQLPAHASGDLPDVSIAEKTRLCIQNIEAILKAAGSEIGKVVKVYPSSPYLLPFSRLRLSKQRNSGHEANEKSAME